MYRWMTSTTLQGVPEEKKHLLFESHSLDEVIELVLENFWEEESVNFFNWIEKDGVVIRVMCKGHNHSMLMIICGEGLSNWYDLPPAYAEYYKKRGII